MKKILLAVLCCMYVFMGTVSAETKSFQDISGFDADELVRIDIRSGSTGLTVVSVESEDIIHEIYSVFEKGNYSPIEKTPGASAGGWLYDVRFRTDILEDEVFSYTLYTGSSEVEGVRYRGDNEPEIYEVIKKYVDNPFDYEGILVGSGTPSKESVTPSDWAKAEVEKADDAGIIPDGFTHKYRDPITRGQFCEIAYNVLDKKTALKVTGESKKFSDTESPSVAALSSAGIIAGRSETEFAPYEYITREEAAVILSKMADAMGIEPDGAMIEAAFPDDAEISQWAKDSVYDCFTLGVMLGTDNGFEPKGTYTVEQAIATMVRLYEITMQDKISE